MRSRRSIAPQVYVAPWAFLRQVCEWLFGSKSAVRNRPEADVPSTLTDGCSIVGTVHVDVAMLHARLARLGPFGTTGTWGQEALDLRDELA